MAVGKLKMFRNFLNRNRFCICGKKFQYLQTVVQCVIHFKFYILKFNSCEFHILKNFNNVTLILIFTSEKALFFYFFLHYQQMRNLKDGCESENQASPA